MLNVPHILHRNADVKCILVVWRTFTIFVISSLTTQNGRSTVNLRTFSFQIHSFLFDFIFVFVFFFGGGGGGGLDGRVSVLIPGQRFSSAVYY